MLAPSVLALSHADPTELLCRAPGSECCFQPDGQARYCASPGTARAHCLAELGGHLARLYLANS